MISPPFFILLKHQVYVVDYVYSISGTNLKSKQLASSPNKDSAIAALKLFGATEYHDWSVKGAHWNMPLTKIENV